MGEAPQRRRILTVRRQADRRSQPGFPDPAKQMIEVRWRTALAGKEFPQLLELVKLAEMGLTTSQPGFIMVSK